jgi:hypothetical protein
MNRNIRLSGLGIEIYSKDFLEMTWDLGVSYGNKLGEGWRLPSPEEMRIIRSLRGIPGLGNFTNYKKESDYYYWTSKEDKINWKSLRVDYTTIYAYFYDMDDQATIVTRKDNAIRVRYVRDIK